MRIDVIHVRIFQKYFGWAGRSVTALLVCLLAVFWCSSVWAGPLRMLPDTGGHTAPVRAMGITPDGRLLVTGSEDRTLRVWDLKAKRCIQTIPLPTGLGGKQGAVFALAISPDGQAVAVGGWMGKKRNEPDMGRVFLLSLPEGRLISTLQNGLIPVNALAFSPNGRFLAVASDDGGVRVWKMPQRAVIHNFKGHKGPVRALAWIDNINFVSGGDDSRILAWGLGVPGSLGKFEGHTAGVTCLAVSPDGETLVSGGYDKTVRKWDIPTMTFVRQLTEENFPVLSLDFNAQGSQILLTTGSRGEGQGVCRILSREAGRARTLFLGHEGGVNKGLFVPKTSLAATTGEDGSVYLWNIWDASLAYRFVGRGRPITHVAFGPQGDEIFWTMEQTKTGVWKEDDILSAFPGMSMRFQDNGLLTLHPEPYVPSKMYAAIEEAGPYRMIRRIGVDPVLSLLEVYKKNSCRIRIQRSYEDGKEHAASTLTPDGHFVISGGGYGELAMYRVKDTKKVRDFKGHTAAITCLAVSPDGSRLVSGSLDQTVRLWNLATGELLATILATNDNEWVAWTPSGYMACSPLGDTLLRCVLAQGEHGVGSVPAALFGRIMYRPDLVSSTLSLGQAKAALTRDKAPSITSELLAKHRPPELTILAPPDGAVLDAGKMPLLFHLGTADTKPAMCQLRMNGHRMLPGKGKSFGVGRQTIPLELQPGENTMGLACVDKQGARSVAHVQTLVKGSKTTNASAELYYLGVGIGRLTFSGKMSLPLPSTDVNMIGRVLTACKGKGYAKVHVRLVSDDYGALPTKSNITKGLEWLKQAGARDTVIIALFGQGVTTRDGRAVLLPRDAKPDKQHGWRLQSVMELGPLLEDIAALPARPLVLLDCVHGNPLDMAWIMRMARDAGVAMLSSSRWDQKPRGKYPNIPCSPFAYALFKGLGVGMFADTSRDGKVRIGELAEYVRKEVQARDNRLMPSLVIPAGYGDFVVVQSEP